MNTYKQTDFVEVGRTFYIPKEDSSGLYDKVIVIKILHDFAIVRSKDEVFNVPFSDLYLLG